MASRWARTLCAATKLLVIPPGASHGSGLPGPGAHAVHVYFVIWSHPAFSMAISHVRKIELYCVRNRLPLRASGGLE